MRVIAGRAKGRMLRAPKSAHVRPTSDLVRGVIFDMLEARGVGWERVLDLYAGSGALGIEALSRGAGWADFAEQDARCCAAIRENLDRTGLADRGRVHCLPVRQALASLEGRYGLVLLDPPYGDPDLEAVLEELASLELVNGESVVSVEHSRRAPLPERIGVLRRIVNRRHGDTCVSLYRVEVQI
jgi:16S rRNA (guanine966-N2)-methyltransferase